MYKKQENGQLASYKMSYGFQQAVITPRVLRMDQTNIIFKDMVSYMTINGWTKENRKNCQLPLN